MRTGLVIKEAAVCVWENVQLFKTVCCYDIECQTQQLLPTDILIHIAQKKII